MTCCEVKRHVVYVGRYVQSMLLGAPEGVSGEEEALAWAPMFGCSHATHLGSTKSHKRLQWMVIGAAHASAVWQWSVDGHVVQMISTYPLYLPVCACTMLVPQRCVTPKRHCLVFTLC